VIGDACGHRRRRTERLVDTAEVVVHEVMADGGGVILDLLGEGVGQPV